MNIKIFSIEKSLDLDTENLIKQYIKKSKFFASIENIKIFNKNIANAQTKDKFLARKSYFEAYLPYFGSFNVGLDEKGKSLDTKKFSKILLDRQEICFFIGGAYGFNEDFLKKCDVVISLSALTFAHKLAKLILFEQVYRALCINNSHPYHK